MRAATNLSVAEAGLWIVYGALALAALAIVAWALIRSLFTR